MVHTARMNPQVINFQDESYFSLCSAAFHNGSNFLGVSVCVCPL